jgi:opacity protein-like surface antigen
MKQCLWLVLTVLILGTTARAQQTPAWELSGGYSSLTGNLIHPRFHLNGGFASVDGNLNSWFGVRFDFGAYYGPYNGSQVMQEIQDTKSIDGMPPQTGPLAGTPIAGSPSTQLFTVGPVFSIRRFGRFTPFAHIGIGGIHAGQAYLGLSQSATTFAASGGGGADFKINNQVAIRVEGNYMTTTFSMPPATFSPGSTQGNIQISTGIVFRLGKR